MFALFGRHVTRWLSAYCEGALPPAQASDVARHLLACRSCRRDAEQVREGVRMAASLRLAPAGAGATWPDLPSWSDLAPRLDDPAPRPFSLSMGWAPAAAAVLVVAVWGLGLRANHRGLATTATAPSALEAAAVAAHRSAAVEMRTGDARLLHRWIADQVGLDVSLPGPGPDHVLEGAMRLPSLSTRAVAVAGRVDGHPVTLVVEGLSGPSDLADLADLADFPDPGATPRMPRTTGKRVVHRSVDGLELAIWTRADRSYALVSDLKGDVACTLCHKRV
jgi:anti-sigma factor RsiW